MTEREPQVKHIVVIRKVWEARCDTCGLTKYANTKKEVMERATYHKRRMSSGPPVGDGSRELAEWLCPLR
ncbi:unnamed protein product [marine sediment metagenome]|uniref:Uncharacterized protein n=1 Tax=marine sediment metagenome TaxID=412755 RepID=X1BZ87_9ZZZZ